MKGISMVDLKRQYIDIQEEIETGIQEVIANATFINGPQVKTFADQLSAYLGVKHVIPCGNGTDALQIALMALGLKPGDEVITPSFTYIATVEVVALLGLKPVFVDVDTEYFNIDIASLKAAITPQTKAIIPVHLYGQAAAMDEVLAIAKEHNIPVIEDTAQALGGDYHANDGKTYKLGTLGTIGCTSFFPSKNLGAYGDGGAMFTNDDALAEKLAMIANHGQKVRYYHEIVGCNSRLDSIQAVVLNAKLPRLDAYCDARRAAADAYDKGFSNNPFITTPARDPKAKHVFHQYTIKLAAHISRDEVQEILATKDIPSMIYYPVPCHKQKMFDYIDEIKSLKLPNTDLLTPIVLSLPIHTELTTEELNYIIHEVNEAVLFLGNQ
ncbi:MAG TPA: DegT/DnrJ/EryC1/StrS family aminotransferase [Chitinophagaceae bacterium]|nr:DegT/DnrJ/EryC1/StrS family aminotransferase [Chitinophagaceae bacterium]